MAVMASWNGKTWGVSSQRIAALNGISHSVELDTETATTKPDPRRLRPRRSGCKA